MILVIRILYIMLIGYLFYRMIKNGGCCGGHTQQGKNELGNTANKKVIHKIVTENQKNRQ